MTAGLQPAAPHGANSTHSRARRCWPNDDAYAVVKVLAAGWMPGNRTARKESNLRPAVLETAYAAMARAQVRTTRMRWCVELRKARRPSVKLSYQARVGPAGIGRFPTPRPLLMIERLAGQARIGAKARRGCTS